MKICRHCGEKKEASAGPSTPRCERQSIRPNAKHSTRRCTSKFAGTANAMSGGANGSEQTWRVGKRACSFRRVNRLGGIRLWLRGVAALGVAALTLAAGGGGLSPGDLDPTFGNNGRVLIPVGTYGAVPTASALQPDGKIVLAAYTKPDSQTYVHCLVLRGPLDPAGESDDVDFLAMRLNRDGSLDSSFGSGGVVRTPINLIPNGEDCPMAITVAPDGGILSGQAACLGDCTLCVREWGDVHCRRDAAELLLPEQWAAGLQGSCGRLGGGGADPDCRHLEGAVR
jgi:Domain of unknown function (DUF5122) beta-propeller